jgi:hypothetical protein
MRRSPFQETSQILYLYAMNMHKIFFAITIWLLAGLVHPCQAQDDGGFVPKPRPEHHDVPKPDILDKIYYGGNLGMNFGKGYAFLEASPLIGYRITDKFSAGLTGTYMYYNFTTVYGENISDNIYGAGVFARYFVLQNVFAHVETKFLNGMWADGERSTIYPVLAGAGYRSKMGSRGSVFIMVLYDLNYDPARSLFPSPFLYTFGFGLGF